MGPARAGVGGGPPGGMLPRDDRGVLTCAECGRTAPENSTGWRAYREDIEAEGDTPALAIFCPECAAREFDTNDPPSLE